MVANDDDDDDDDMCMMMPCLVFGVANSRSALISTRWLGGEGNNCMWGCLFLLVEWNWTRELNVHNSMCGTMFRRVIKRSYNDAKHVESTICVCLDVRAVRLA